MEPLLLLIILTFVAGIFFDVTNGWNDSANAIATVVSTRVLTPGQALGMSAVLNFVGALISIKVAKTMGSGVVKLPVDPKSMVIVLTAMISAAAWVAWCTKLGLPVSCSHALVGGLLGSAVFLHGWKVVVWNENHKGVLWIFVALFLSPLLGFLLGYLLVVLKTWFAHGLEATPRQGRRVFGFLQLCSSSFMAYQHGQNDAQKVMGVLALGLFVGGFLRDPQTGGVITDIQALYVPWWVILSCAGAMAFGTAVGGWAVIRTLGTKLAKITTLEGCAAETGAGVVLEVAAKLGVPVSTTHTITGGIVGVGAAKGARAVKWGIGAKIIYAWVFTLPVCFLLGGTLSWFASRTSPLLMVGLVILMTVGTYILPGFLRRPSPQPA
jgi:PiT family inorganic phosphate transporter